MSFRSQQHRRLKQIPLTGTSGVGVFNFRFRCSKSSDARADIPVADEDIAPSELCLSLFRCRRAATLKPKCQLLQNVAPSELIQMYQKSDAYAELQVASECCALRVLIVPGNGIRADGVLRGAIGINKSRYTTPNEQESATLSTVPIRTYGLAQGRGEFLPLPMVSVSAEEIIKCREVLGGLVQLWDEEFARFGGRSKPTIR